MEEGGSVDKVFSAASICRKYHTQIGHFLEFSFLLVLKNICKFYVINNMVCAYAPRRCRFILLKIYVAFFN